MIKKENQRGYFRIDDEVFLYVNPIDRADIVDTDTYFDSFRQSTIMAAKFHQQRTLMVPVLTEINIRDTATASYLSMLSDQIDLLANRLLTISIFASNEALQSVNISAESMQFRSTIAYEQGDLLEMIYVLFPGGDYIPVLAEIVRCEKNIQADEYIVSVKYNCMNDDDKELVIHHILYLQRQLLQQKRITG